MAEEETEDLVIEFEGNFDLDSVRGQQIQVIGIDTDEPVLRIDSKFYKIDVKDSIGSRLILQQGMDGKLSYYAKTDKVVTARRVMIKPK
ncbi:hypothetical protein SUGI_1496750 [Cryptomeria japonica]|uniref:Transcription factor TFIIIC triple barrel domain-containing protein n=1 Tax=Cryptomeria japonica TaxID=3369 RepID=A0AAD3NUI8_CRYJA|nr:hypothetical protein SUGI_1496750 [Cryptomeria japonica]